MACEYYSYTAAIESFQDEKILEKALYRLNQRRSEFRVNGLTVEAQAAPLAALKQAYQAEATKAALKKKGFLVTETKTMNGIKLTVRGGK